ncbi:Flagellar motor switch protein FliM [Moorella thermoacetica]|uniref:Flagellar motor switch protein FliM n=1 Tax=Neomoorella thermoacetica TaxID=1525 RepID=A0AAC9MUF7_NEOTH|nr:flagellar motor switch protein FliM [Moorella thermoacetica]AOQ23461.1 Flagellar motor switch protein FliM [Moorella thermoacetica]TYL13646.1 Flagellar motor switch protein FliM [Moorella thermoacetica]
MADVLSQAEIDALLQALNSGEVQTEVIKEEATPKAKKYDFRRPNKFSKEHLRTLYMIHENYGRLVANFLSAYLRASIQVKIVSVEQMTYEDFILSLPTPTLMNVFSMEPLKGSAVLETNMNFIFPIIDLLFGGRGEMVARNRELTEIELHVLRRLNSLMLEQLSYSWSDIQNITPKLENMETNPQFTQAISPNETVAVITMGTTVGKYEGLLNLCLPYMLLEPVISRLSASHWFATGGEREARPDYRTVVEKILAEVPVELIAYIGRTRLPVRDFIQLQVGDVITLEKTVGEDLELYVDGHHKFQVQPGIVNKKIAVQVTEVV